MPAFFSKTHKIYKERGKPLFKRRNNHIGKNSHIKTVVFLKE